MKRLWGNILILTFSLLFFPGGKAMGIDADVKVELFNVESGLSQSNVSALLVDSYGFLWIGTQDGLNRFDGYSYKIFRNNPLDVNSISNNSILSIAEDKDGNLWVGTWKGLSWYNRKTNTFKNYHHDPANEKSIGGDRVFTVHIDRNGTVWINTIRSVDRYNFSTDNFTRFPHYHDITTSFADNNDFSILEDSKRRFWVGTKDGLFLFDKGNGSYKRYSHDPMNPSSISNNRIKSVAEDSFGNIWVATADGLNYFNSQSENFKRYISTGQPGSLPSSKVNDLYVNSQGRLFVGTELGLCSYNHAIDGFVNHRNYVDGREIYSPIVNTIVEDNSHILWVGTQSGLVKWDMKPRKFKTYGKSVDGENLFSGNSVASILEVNNFVWVGTWGTGLHLFNRENGKIVKYSQGSKHPYSICNDYVHVVRRLKSGAIIIGTQNGVQKFDAHTGTFVDYFQGKTKLNDIFKENRVYSIREDQSGNVWFATRNGLHMYDHNSFTSYYNDPSDTLTISSNEIHCIELDSNGVWIGAFNGLNFLNFETGLAHRFYRRGGYKEGELISNDIVSLKLDSKGILWVGTASGLHFYRKELGKFTLLTESDGLPNNLIYGIEEDNKGRIWLSTNSGLAMLNPADNSVATYSVSDGLQSNEFNVGASFISSRGELFFGGIQGFNAFFSDSIKRNITVPKVAITSLDLIGQKGIVEISATGRTEIVVPKEFSAINIEFSVLDFTYPAKNEFRYKMVGIEDDWISIGARRSATFSNLREGVYHFVVQGANSDKVWNEEGVSLKIIVKTSIWRTRMAYAFYLFISVASVFLFLRTRTKILRKTSRLLKEREVTMSEMEDQKEALLAQNKNITDSINYAKRIQEALIPSEAHFKSILPESFILYLPKDIVSGDFYWINETKNKIFVAAIDCTGHGVPGAFMSIIGVELLRNITNILGINDAAEILNRLDKGVHDTFTKGNGEENVNVKDGMDVSFCVIDKEQNLLQFAGAFSNLYLIRDSKIIEVKGDRFSVGTGGDLDQPLFNSHLITIQPDDMIYMFTDGYVDQFGGPEGKKYKFRRFRHLLLNIHKYPLEIQRKYLIGSINEWKGAHEQVDDILIIGIKPDLSVLF